MQYYNQIERKLLEFQVCIDSVVGLLIYKQPHVFVFGPQRWSGRLQIWGTEDPEQESVNLA